MGTLVNDTNKTKKSRPPRNKSKDIEVEESKDEAKLKKKIDKEYYKIRQELEYIRQAFDVLETARATDDINIRLKNLEKASKRIRKGSFMFKGAKYHSKLLTKLEKIRLQ